MSKLKKAMEKAKKDRNASGKQKSPDNHDIMNSSQQHFNEPPLQCDGVNPDYKRTKTAPINPEILRRNKIISLFQEEAMADRIKILRTQVLNAKT